MLDFFAKYALPMSLASYMVMSCRSEIQLQTSKRPNQCLNTPELTECLTKDPSQGTGSLGFSLNEENFISKSKNVEVSWTTAAGATSYKLTIGRETSCLVNPLFTYEQEGISKNVTFVEDGTYYLCAFAIIGDQLELPARNNGTTLTIDTKAPIISIGSPIITASVTIDPALDIVDATAVSYLWESDSEYVVFIDPESTEPGITFTQDGNYTVTLTVTDSAGHSSRQEFTIIWQDTANNTAEDYNITFEKAYYQTRSIKRLLIPSEFLEGYESKIVIDGSEFEISQGSSNGDGLTLLQPSSQAVTASLPYGTNNISLKLFDGFENESFDAITLMDFEYFGITTTNFADGSIEKSGLSGGLTPYGGPVESGDTKLITGFNAITSE